MGGDVASATTVLNLTPLDHPDFEDGTGSVYLADEIQSANLIINELAANDPQLAGMGTTCTALLMMVIALSSPILVIRVRIVCVRALMASLSRFLLTIRLCSVCSMRVVLPPQEAENHPHKNVIMRVLGDVDASPRAGVEDSGRYSRRALGALFGRFGCCGVPGGD